MFRPQLVNGHAVGGVCFIRMGALRPAHFPRAAGVTTENAAHRFAVEWDDDQGSHTGVWIPRRDTNSRTTAAMGASIFPGAYHHARFQVTESADTIRIGVRSRDRAIQLSVSAAPATALDSQLFANLMRPQTSSAGVPWDSPHRPLTAAWTACTAQHQLDRPAHEHLRNELQPVR